MTFTTVSCKRIVADFRFLSEFEKTISEPFNNLKTRNQSRPGTLLKMLLSQVDFSDRQAYQVPFSTNSLMKIDILGSLVYPRLKIIQVLGLKGTPELNPLNFNFLSAYKTVRVDIVLT